MNLSMSTDMIRFDSVYLRDNLEDKVSLSVFGPEGENQESIGTFPLKFANLNVREFLDAGYATALNPLREINKEMDIHYSMSPIATGHEYPDLYSLSLELGTNLVIPPIDFGSLAAREQIARVKATREAVYSYAFRIEFLREEAVIEGVDFNRNSERDFWTFIRLIPFIRRGSLFLMDNGDLRVVWDDDEDNLVGIQFLGNCLARYVIFKSRTENESVSRVSGTDTLQGVSDQIRAFKLESLLSA